MDRASSPGMSLPPSSAPAPSMSNGSFPRPARRADALDMADDEAMEETTGTRRRRKTRTQMNGDVPPVRDATSEKISTEFFKFLDEFTESINMAPTPSSDGDGMLFSQNAERVYVEQVHTMKDYDLSTLYVDFGHLLLYDEILATAISNSYYRFLPYLRQAIFTLVRKHQPEYAYENVETRNSDARPREFQLAFHSLPLVSAIRDLRTEKIGRLMSISGTVTRTSEVRPELLFGSFSCEVCQGTVDEVEQQFKYTEPSLCRNPTCGNRAFWQLSIDRSTFTDWQKVRIQENSNEIPTGSMPRSLDVILRGDLVERAKAGDKCTFTGAFIVVPDVSQLGLPGVNSEMMRAATRNAASGGLGSAGVTGLKSLGVRDLQYKTAFLACMVAEADQRKPGSTDVRGEEEEGEDEQTAFIKTLSEPEVEELRSIVHSDYIYSRLVESIAPTVYGHEIIKKGLLLQLMGGVHKSTHEGIHLRGDINICIVGDPSTSKSQFLKYICSFLPRAVYTSGKASSAAGLTAAVVKDEETGEFTIEAGALMLADNGICAIDEFDKMDIADQVAIHEAMEQQTISIAKAGIHATLNARTSILAAANPIGGRYDRKKTLRQNLAMSAPIMSRFDLFFVVLDQCDEKVDLNIARHIVRVHRFQDEAIAPEFSTETLQRYIRYARTFKPKFTPEAADLLVEKYRLLRQDDSSGAGRNSYRITVRQLESMIRLSEAIARANCTNDITPPFVREAYSLLRQSIIHVEQDDIDFEDEDLANGQVDGEEHPTPATDGDETMDGILDESYQDESSLGMNGINGHQVTSPSRAGGSGAALAASSPAPAPESAPPAKRKMKITHDKYVAMQTLTVMHLAEEERRTGKGVDQDELIDWYLESKEDELRDVEELEYERELFVKVLKRLVKDNFLMSIRGDVSDTLPTSSQAEESMATDGDGDARVYYMVHPSVDTDTSSSFQ